ncbi:hypothetical protein [Paenibacillus amylolyticus]
MQGSSSSLSYMETGWTILFNFQTAKKHRGDILKGLTRSAFFNF